MAVYSYAEQFEQALQQKYEKELTSYALEQSNPQVKLMLKLLNYLISQLVDIKTTTEVIWDLIQGVYLMNGNQRN